jgi:hypothetical protein
MSIEKNIFGKMSKLFTVEKDHKKVRDSKFELATSIRAASRKLQSLKDKVADSAVGVAPL